VPGEQARGVPRARRPWLDRCTPPRARAPSGARRDSGQRATARPGSALGPAFVESCNCPKLRDFSAFRRRRVGTPGRAAREGPAGAFRLKPRASRRSPRHLAQIDAVTRRARAG
jgi:hypothetical protein